MLQGKYYQLHEGTWDSATKCYVSWSLHLKEEVILLWQPDGAETDE